MSKTFGLHDTDESIKSLQRMLNELFDLELKEDGNIGKITQSALEKYQQQNNIVEKDEYGACYGPVTQAKAEPFIKHKYLQHEDYVEAAAILGVEVASIKAFAKTEAKEFGFLSNGYPVILFERHIFYKEIVKNSGQNAADKYSTNYPDICNSSTGGYIGGKAEIKRLDKAASINNLAAYLSCSWGLFQVMGFNYKICGYSSIEDFVVDMKISERNHLKAFIGFIKSNHSLHSALIIKDWPTVAKNYNGAAYAKNKYDIKMANAYESFKA